MDKFSFIALWDIYNGFLTPTQREITNLYFNLDLTVSEIALQKGISRQAVSECMKICKKQLEDFENRLHFCEKLNFISLQESLMLTETGKWVEKFKKIHPELTEDINDLESILDKDYSDEVKKILADPKAQTILNKDYTGLVYGREKTGKE